MMYPAEYLCLASLQEHLRAPRKTYAIGASAITLMGLAGAAVCCMLDKIGRASCRERVCQYV